MKQNAISIRPFIGSKDFNLSRSFYRDWGFVELVLENKLSYFEKDNLGFYLQDAYVKDWVDNTMVFMQVADVVQYWEELSSLNLSKKYPCIRLVPTRIQPWGKVCYVHDPSGVLWHIGEFFPKTDL